MARCEQTSLVSLLGCLVLLFAWRSETTSSCDGEICFSRSTRPTFKRRSISRWRKAGRAALKTVSQLVSVYGQTYTDRANARNDIEKIQDTFFQELSVLWNLQQAGARESTFFSVRLSNYNAFLLSLTSLFDAGLDLSRYQEITWFLDHVRQQIQSLMAAISDEFNILSASLSPEQTLSSSRMNEAFAAFEEKVHEMGDEGILRAAPLKTAMAFAGHFAALSLLCDELNNIRGVLQGLPRFDQLLPEPKPQSDFLPTIDWVWVKVGIKGGLAALISIVCLKWIHPPGPKQLKFRRCGNSATSPLRGLTGGS